MTTRTYGFVGLGQMGGPMAANIAKAGFPLHVYDRAGTQALAPEGSTVAGGAARLAESCETIFLSVPDGTASLALAREIAAVRDPRVTTVIDLSTIGGPAAQEAAAILKDAGIAYADAPVSGGRKGAIAASISLMWAGDKALFDAHAEVIGAFVKNPFYVGATPGQGQALKMLNNFLSATAVAATSEAVLYGLSQGLDMKTILDVVNVSSGQNTATSIKFPDQVLTGKFDVGFSQALITKDVRLYIENSTAAATPNYIGRHVFDVLGACNAVMPEADSTRIFEFIRDGGEDGLEDR